MQIKFDFNNMMQEQLGEQGISESQIEAVREKAKESYEYLEANRGKGWMGWTELPYNQEDVVRDIIYTAAEVRAHFDNFVVLGIGGSALGPMAAFNALCHLHYNELDPKKRGVKFYVEDNVDPERMLALLDVIDPAKTMFNVITKSGATSETMSQYLIITDILKKKLGKDWTKHIIATTSESKGNLIKLAKANGFKTYFIPDGVGGRFSELCPVGLLPAALLGIDIILDLAYPQTTRTGGRYMDQFGTGLDTKLHTTLRTTDIDILDLSAFREMFDDCSTVEDRIDLQVLIKVCRNIAENDMQAFAKEIFIRIREIVEQ